MTLNIIEESRRARLEGRTGQYRELKPEAVRAVRRDRGARGAVESLWSTDSTCLQRNPDVAFL